MCRQCELHERLAGGRNPFMYHKCPRHDSRTEAQKIDDLHQAAIDEQEDAARRRELEVY